MSAAGGVGNNPRVLDTSDPRDGKCGDSDLGSPNGACPGGGPGRGDDGKPDGRGPNCSPLGNVLIIQEPGSECPDDNVDGGIMEFTFDPMVESIRSIGLLDIDYAAILKVTFMNDEGELEDTNIMAPLLGDNSYQLLFLDEDKIAGPVQSLKLILARSGAVSSITFCSSLGVEPIATTAKMTTTTTEPEPTTSTTKPTTTEEDITTTTQAVPVPTKTPPSAAPPTKSPPSPSPSTMPTVQKECVNIDFSKSADGVTLSGGKYVSDQWESLGLSLYASGGRGYLPRLFNTSSVGNDPDLGSPNEKCTPSGPGRGAGGEPGSDAPNCNPLGNVLIIQNSDESITIPDDNKNGGSIIFEFEEAVRFESLGLLDIDYKTSILIMTESESGRLAVLPRIEVELKGDNSFFMLDINEENVKQVRVTFAHSGAVTEINFCPPSPSPPESNAIYINAGGPDYVDPEGNTWVSDEGYYIDGMKYSTDEDISNTKMPALYQTERFGPVMKYDIPVPNGSYTVKLHFAEIFFTRIDARVFAVFSEGKLVTDDLDVFRQAGNKGNKAYVLTVEDAVVDDGSLTLDFVGLKQKAKLSAIEIHAID